MTELRIHYAGELHVPTSQGGETHIRAGWAACCSGARARAVRSEGRHSYDSTRVTCKRCLALIDKALR